MEQFKQEWRFSLHALKCLNNNKKLILIALVAKLIHLAILVWLAHPLISLLMQDEPITKVSLATSYSLFFRKFSFYIILLVALYLNNIIGTFLHAWSSAIIFFQDASEKKTAWGILKQRLHLWPQIALWCLMRSLLGGPAHLFVFFLRFYRWFPKTFINGSWHLSSYFSVMLIFLEKCGAKDAYGDSCTLLRNTWGEHVIVRIGRPFRNIAFLLLLIFLIAPAWILQYFPIAHWGITSGIITTLLFGAVFTVETAIRNIYSAALYAYASEKRMVYPFTESEVQAAFLPKYD